MADVTGLADDLRARARLRFEAGVEAAIETLAGNAPVDTGQLRDGVVSLGTVEGPDRFSATITSTARSDEGVDYGLIQDQGTGPIFPVEAKALRFFAGGDLVFAASTRGVPATGWWSDTVNEGWWSDALDAGVA